jgi:hypothetical protein
VRRPRSGVPKKSVRAQRKPSRRSLKKVPTLRKKIIVSSEQDLKSCCAPLYESDFVRLLLGGSFHPGGLKLTTRLGQLLKLGEHSQVLDVACGKGASAILLADTFACVLSWDWISAKTT